MYQTSPPSCQAAFVSSSPNISPIWRSAPHVHSSPHVTTPPLYVSLALTPLPLTTSTRPSTTPRALWEDPVTSPHLGSFDEGFQSPPRPSGAPFTCLHGARPAGGFRSLWTININMVWAYSYAAWPSTQPKDLRTALAQPLAFSCRTPGSVLGLNPVSAWACSSVRNSRE